MANAKKVSPEALVTLTRAAVKNLSSEIPGKFEGGGTTVGFVLREDLGAAENMRLAELIAKAVASGAKSKGMNGIKPTAVVFHRRDKVIVGYVPAEMD